MDEIVKEFLKPLGPSATSTPATSRIFNIALAAATSTATDISGANYAGLYSEINGGRFVTLTSSVDIWYRWASATGTVDETTTPLPESTRRPVSPSTPANQGILLPGGTRVTERPPSGTTFLIAKATPLAGTLCVQVSSKALNSEMSA